MVQILALPLLRSGGVEEEEEGRKLFIFTLRTGSKTLRELARLKGRRSSYPK